MITLSYKLTCLCFQVIDLLNIRTMTNFQEDSIQKLTPLEDQGTWKEGFLIAMKKLTHWVNKNRLHINSNKTILSKINIDHRCKLQTPKNSIDKPHVIHKRLI